MQVQNIGPRALRSHVLAQPPDVSLRVAGGVLGASDGRTRCLIVAVHGLVDRPVQLTADVRQGGTDVVEHRREALRRHQRILKTNLRSPNADW